MIVTDIKPFSMVNYPGFLNYSKLLDPRFIEGSAMFYRRLLDKAFIKVQQKLSEAQPASVSIKLDGWSQHHAPCANNMEFFFPYVTKKPPSSACDT
jgi:hypothetical protein